LHWCVVIEGDPIDLEMLATSMSGYSTSITAEAGRFILQSDTFGGIDLPEVIEGKATEILARLSGCVRLMLNGRMSLRVGSLYRVRDDGGRDFYILAKPGEYYLRDMPATLEIAKGDGSKEIRGPADVIPSMIERAAIDENFAKALRLRDGDALGWSDLYRLYEVIETGVSRSFIVKNGWATDGEIRRFKHTANSVAAVGDEARHGKEWADPPSQPLALSDARTFIDSLLRRWNGRTAA